MKGWIDKNTLYIPPVSGSGFKEKVIIREYIPPQRKKKTEKEKYSGDAPTVFVSNIDYGEDSTVFVPNQQISAAIKRLKTGEIIPVKKQNLVIGKQSGADYVIHDNRTISRRHARLYWKDGSYWLEDLNSSNHVFVDGRRINDPVRLSDRMTFRLSDDEVFEFIEDNRGNEPDYYGK